MLKYCNSRAPCDTKCQTAGHKHQSLFPLLLSCSQSLAGCYDLLSEIKVLIFKWLCSVHGLPCQKSAALCPKQLSLCLFHLGIKIKLVHVGNTMDFVYVINGASPSCSEMLSDRNNFPLYSLMHSEDANAFWKLVVQHTLNLPLTAFKGGVENPDLKL